MQKNIEAMPSLKYIPDKPRGNENLFQAEEKKLENEFNEKLKEKQKEGEPAVEVSIFFAAHKTAKDIEGLKKPFANCDIFIPEGCGWTNEILKCYRQVSEGMLTPDEALKKMEFKIWYPNYSANLKALEILHNSQKPLMFIDLPRGSDILYRYMSSEILVNQDLSSIEMGSVNSYVDKKFDMLKEHLKDSVKIEIEREKFMLQNLYPQLQKLLSERPDLKTKEKLNILLFLGAAHTGIYHALKKSAPSTKKDMSRMPFVFSIMPEIKRRYMFGKEVDDKLIIQFIFEYLWLHKTIYSNLKLITDDSLKIQSFGRALISSFSAKEMREINSKKDKTLFLDKLNEKNIKLPKTEQELDEMTKKLHSYEIRD